MADIWVSNAQLWLNNNYRNVSGFTEVTVDGSSGWQTMYALTRALQHELGITALSDSFGPGTTAAFTAQIGSITSSTTKPKVIGILQAALWCKGYSGDEVFGTWTSVVASSVSNLRGHAGLTAVASVDVKLMKSLLSMDAYVVTPGGTELVRAGQRWLNSRYVGRRPWVIIPCDGHFTRDVQRGMLFGIQFEIGLSDSVANGNFGDGTKSGLRTQGVVTSGSTDGAKAFVSLFQLALAFNGYDVPRTGTFAAPTRLATLDFQRFLEINDTGNGDFGTWAALLVSTGDPDRTVGVKMIDRTTALTNDFAVQMRTAGYNIVGRYLTVAGKALARGELDIIFNNGFALVPIFQNFNNAASYFTRAIGLDHGWQAARRARQLNFKEGVVIFFAVDYDAFASEIETLLRPYFEGVAEGLKRSVSVEYKIGIYATRNVAAQVVNKGLAEAIWVSGMSTGYSGNLGFPMPANWWYNQIQEISSINIDRNSVSSNARPTPRTQVGRIPERNDQERQLYFYLVEQILLAETELDKRLASDLNVPAFVMHFLMSEIYHYGPFLKYVPYQGLVIGQPEAVATRVLSSLNAYLGIAGSPVPLRSVYEGDIEHFGVVVQGIIYWGAWAGNGAIGIGDLGGWSLDVVQLWANYKKFVGPTTIEHFVSTNLGAGSENTSEWRLPDLIADADGWLVGRDVYDAVRLADSLSNWWAEVPRWQDRLKAFIEGRFRQPGKSLNQSIQENIVTIFANSWPWPDEPRDGFQEGQPDPTPEELASFAAACANTLLIRAEMPTGS